MLLKPLVWMDGNGLFSFKISKMSHLFSKVDGDNHISFLDFQLKGFLRLLFVSNCFVGMASPKPFVLFVLQVRLKQMEVGMGMGIGERSFGEFPATKMAGFLQLGGSR